jgi:hypothetical protein
MQKLIAITCVALLLAGGLIGVAVHYDSIKTVNINDMTVSCVDGVEYWTRTVGYKGYMAVRIDPDTLTFVTCD